MEKYSVAIAAGVLFFGLVGKIIWDWLKNRGGDTVYNALKDEIRGIRTDFDQKLDEVIKALGDLNIKLAENYATQESIIRIWNKIEEMEKEIASHPCASSRERIDSLRDKVKDLEAKHERHLEKGH